MDDVEPNKCLPNDLLYQRKIPRAQAIDIFKRFEWSMDKLIDHMYTTTEGTGRRCTDIKLADPVQVKRILVKHGLPNSMAPNQRTNLSFQPAESNGMKFKAEAYSNLLSEQASPQATPSAAVFEHGHVGKQGNTL